MLSDNVVEIFLETSLFCFIIALSKFQADSNWTKTDIIVYVMFLFFAVSTYTIFSLVKFTVKLLTRAVTIQKSKKVDNSQMNSQVNYSGNNEEELNEGYFQGDMPVNNLPSVEVEELKIEDHSVFIGRPDQFDRNIDYNIENEESKEINNPEQFRKNMPEFNNLNERKINGDEEVPLPSESNIIDHRNIRVNFDEEED